MPHSVAVAIVMSQNRTARWFGEVREFIFASTSTESPRGGVFERASVDADE